MFGYLGVELGSSPVDVSLSLGKPNLELNSDKNKDLDTLSGKRYIMYAYTRSYDSSMTIVKFLETNGKFETSLICKTSPDGYDELLGIDGYSTEKDIMGRLGTPSSISIRADGLAKKVYFEKWKVGFDLEKNKVSMMCVAEPGLFRYPDEYTPPVEL